MSKTSILLLFATVTQSVLALDRPDSCAPLTTIGADLVTLQLGKDMARYGYRRSAQVIFDELLSILAGRSGHKQNVNLRAERAKNQSWTGFLLGTNPILDAMALFDTKLDVLAVSQLVGVAFQPVSAHIFLAIQKAQGDHYKAKKAEIDKLLETVRKDVANVIGIFSAAEIPAQTFPKGNENVTECVMAKAVANVDLALVAIFEGIHLLADALPNIKTKHDVEKYSSEMLAIRKKAVEHFDAEVREKYSVRRNRVIANFLEKTGTMPGLFALQSPYDDYLSV